MSCDRARRLFGACWDDELTHAEREWLETHLGGCPRCRTEYDEYSRALELVGALPRTEAPPDLVERVLSRSRHAAVAPDMLGARPVRWVPAVATAAAAVAVLALAALFVLPRVPGRGPGSGASSPVAGAQGGPAVPVLVSNPRADQVGAPREHAGETAAMAADDPFDHSADVEFVLDPVTLNRGRATVAHPGARRPGAEGERAIISF